MSAALRIIPLGGLGEFGANCLVLETERDLLVVDAGLLFPDDNGLGLEAIAPDFGYIVKRKEKLRAILLTHGHEDHIGALPTLLSRVIAPVFGPKLTLEMVEGKFRERGLKTGLDFRPLAPGSTIRAGGFTVRTIAIAHSIPQALAFAIGTPAGTVVHSGDFKIDVDPLDGTKTDLETLREIGREGVLLLLGDSTNADRSGRSAAESGTRVALERMFENAPGRVVLTTFSSHLARLTAFASEASRRGRKLALFGRSVIQNIEIAERLGLASIPFGTRLPPADSEHPVPKNAAVIAAGCQGEPTSALVRASKGELLGLAFEPRDRIAFSARVIPGREKPVLRTGEALLRLGCEIRDGSTDSDLHASGHAAADDLIDLAAAVRPRHFVPIHGDYRRLLSHSRLVRESGHAKEIHLVENGQVLEFAEDGSIHLPAERAETGRFAILGEWADEVAPTVLKDRARLGANGSVFAALALEKGRPAGPPVVAIRGVSGPADDALALDARSSLTLYLNSLGPRPKKAAEWQEEIEKELKRWFRREHGRRPVVVGVTLEV